MSGFLLLDKAKGLSSNAALQQVRRLYGRVKAGHGGSLDPLASGMLPIFMGQATKFTRFLLEAPKSYAVVAQLGRTTTTGDAEGDILNERPVPELSQDLLQACFKNFTGEQLQIPPMYSALKVAGKPLYAYARQGKELPREARAINIYSIKFLDLQGSLLSLEISCSKGTYIRSLVESIGEYLGCGAYVQDLRRLSVSAFLSNEMYSLESVQALEPQERLALLKPVESLLSHMPVWQLSDTEGEAFTHGRPLIGELDGWVRVYKQETCFVGAVRLAEGVIQERCSMVNCPVDFYSVM